jgi:hypothetical protein
MISSFGSATMFLAAEGSLGNLHDSLDGGSLMAKTENQIKPLKIILVLKAVIMEVFPPLIL